MVEALVARFRERIQREPTVDYTSRVPPIRPRPPITPEALAAAEARLGFRLPPLLRALYTQVGDGGYGPGRGLEVLAEGQWSIAAHVEALRHLTAGPPNPSGWPGQFIPLVSWGCLYRSWVDCSRPPYAVWFDDPDYGVEGAPESDYFYPQADSLEGWLSGWLDGADPLAGRRRRKPAEPGAAADGPRL